MVIIEKNIIAISITLKYVVKINILNKFSLFILSLLDLSFQDIRKIFFILCTINKYVHSSKELALMYIIKIILLKD